jgi:hypothetical protein
MDRCKTCKHWEKNTRICTVAYLEKYSGVQHICWDQDGGRHEVSTGNVYGCIHWEGVTKPFFVEKEGDFGGCHNHWRIVHDPLAPAHGCLNSCLISLVVVVIVILIVVLLKGC